MLPHLSGFSRRNPPRYCEICPRNGGYTLVPDEKMHGSVGKSDGNVLKYVTFLDVTWMKCPVISYKHLLCSGSKRLQITSLIYPEGLSDRFRFFRWKKMPDRWKPVWKSFPDGSMYGIFTYIWHTFDDKCRYKHSIHGSYGIVTAGIFSHFPQSSTRRMSTSLPSSRKRPLTPSFSWTRWSSSTTSLRALSCSSNLKAK